MSPRTLRQQQPESCSPPLRRSSCFPWSALSQSQHTVWNGLEAPLTIKPAPGKRCYLARLPVEVRLIIYQNILGNPTIHLNPRYRGKKPARGPLLWPALLRVCRAIRAEASYEFYSKTAFVGFVYQNNFRDIIEWLGMLPLVHRTHLQRNKHLLLDLHSLDERHWNAWFPRHTGVDPEAWADCRLFGNIYEVPTRYRLDFLLMSRLATWFLWCARSTHCNFDWEYRVQCRYWTGAWKDTTSEDLAAFLEQSLGMFRRNCVRFATLTAAQKRLMAKQALNLLDSLCKTHREQKIKVDELWMRREWHIRRMLYYWEYCSEQR